MRKSAEEKFDCREWAKSILNKKRKNSEIISADETMVAKNLLNRISFEIDPHSVLKPYDWQNLSFELGCLLFFWLSVVMLIFTGGVFHGHEPLGWMKLLKGICFAVSPWILLYGLIAFVRLLTLDESFDWKNIYFKLGLFYAFIFIVAVLVTILYVLI